MKQYDIVLWDVDQTLLDFKKSQRYAVRKAFKQFGLPCGQEVIERYSQINDSCWKRYEKGEIAWEEVFYGRFRTLFREIGRPEVSEKEVAPIYQSFLGLVYFYRDDSYELCRRLSKSCRQFAVTNGAALTQRNKLRLSGLSEWMEEIFISEEMGKPKPMKEFFDQCFRRIGGFERERAIIVGDSLTSDMLGGNRAGIDCCWYNPENRIKDIPVRIDYEIENLWEIERIIHGEVIKSKAETVVSFKNSP